MNQPRDDADTPREHIRFTAYLQALTCVTDDQEFDLLAAVLADPDQAMAQSAVVRHLERRALELLRTPEYRAWEHRMTNAVSHHTFLTRRLQEWSLYRSITLALPWTANTLIAASDWLQRWVSQTTTSPEALAVLANDGRTRRVRNTARTRSNNTRQQSSTNLIHKS